ncbi:type II toxin-antitoxin system PemK/MazF family toxin [Saccharopolyspora cebuensis]|uniref:Type II toxin-antitoxin system PemK/MazF family toxin n=1 Tax=Saccharopolyspora cebuensis TaxID=418759 RepID=A0ABV4CIU2_9PSEU
MSIDIVRGRIYAAEIEDRGEKFYLAISNNHRNRALPDFLAVQLTTTPKPDIDSVVTLDHGDHPWTGWVPCDNVEKVYRDEVTRDLGALPPPTMRRVDSALRAALGL